jgi:hypothetical protein
LTPPLPRTTIKNYDKKVTPPHRETSTPSAAESTVAKSWGMLTIDRATLEELLEFSGDFLDDDGSLPENDSRQPRRGASIKPGA